jgi:hypothetical protein
MNAKEDSWYVKYRGHTLGPIHTQQVKTSIQKRELGSADKIAAAGNPVWQEIGQCAAFQGLFVSPHAKPIPSPSTVVFKKRKVEIPKHEIPLSPSVEKPLTAPPVAAAPELAVLTPPVKQNAPAKAVKKMGTLPHRSEPKKLVKKKTGDQKAKSQKETRPTPAKVEQTISENLPVASSVASPVSLPEEAPVAQATPAKSNPTPAPQVSQNILASFPEKPPLAPTGASAGELLSDTKSLIGLWQEWKDFEEPLDPPKIAKKTKTEQEAKGEFPFDRAAKDFSPLPSMPLETSIPAETSKAIHIQLTLSKTWLAIFSLLFFGLVAGGLLYFQAQKTRDLKDLHLSDPSSPTIQPSTPDDPIPALKAPTRPKRE